jgi:hypothetical protein
MGSRWIISLSIAEWRMLLWNDILSRLGLNWVMPSSVVDGLLVFGGAHKECGGLENDSTIMWCIWRERNARCFEDSARSFEDIVHYFLFTLYTWNPLVVSFPDFLSRLSSPS